MSKLTELRAIALADLQAVPPRVMTYVTELEHAASSNRTVVIIAGVLGLVVGGIVGHLV